MVARDRLALPAVCASCPAAVAYRCLPCGRPVCRAHAIACRGCGCHCCPQHATAEPGASGPAADGRPGRCADCRRRA